MSHIENEKFWELVKEQEEELLEQDRKMMVESLTALEYDDSELEEMMQMEERYLLTRKNR